MITKECYDLATKLFRGWIFVDSARRYCEVEERDKALTATANAGLAWLQLGYDNVIPENEARALGNSLRGVVDALEKKDFVSARVLLRKLSEDTFSESLQKVVTCECKGR